MPAPHDVPGPGELVAAVREFLERDVLAGLDGRTRFHALVAINTLGIVERELDHGREHADRHRARLRELGFPDDASLAAAIREGACDDRYVQLKDALTEMVRDKLAVANPGYTEG
ncbi:DUF6285 domain-containing protein [Actinomadura rupiterrae]|uniref:DUF6285 domain-containing protein n=1 Tax=Actinomadura rupiterrae TaxID=559627 RepID=UPI0020A34132|nr:DUF6285 domain-containing protein [Actinomadura rupiterrae]MCP2342329.1 hypothetical protein [Actinomadura rupiterrae]